eukprot:11462934-Alexandrium_andersonii.AAC.1
MRFHRSRSAGNGKRANRAQKCPADILDKMSKSGAAANYYFDLWIGHSEDWGQVVSFEKSFVQHTGGSSF